MNFPRSAQLTPNQISKIRTSGETVYWLCWYTSPNGKYSAISSVKGRRGAREVCIQNGNWPASISKEGEKLIPIREYAFKSLDDLP
jgi:hypothetical protein